MGKSGPAARRAAATQTAEAIWQALLARRRDQSRPGALIVADPADAEATALLALYAPLTAMPPHHPFAVAHLAQSLDGRIATLCGASRWLSGEADLLHTHRMRALADAVVVGAGTVHHDDPKLTVRRCAGPSPVRVVIDPDRRLEARHQVFRDGEVPTLLVAAADCAGGASLGTAEILRLPRAADGTLSPRDLRHALAARGLTWLFVEGGGVTISRFLAACALDRLQLTLAPVLLGSGRPGLTLPEIADPSHGLRPRMRRLMLDDDALFECIFDE